MKDDRSTREKTKDPFRKTILEKIREFVGNAFENNKQHQIRARLHWFACSDWRRTELEQELEKMTKLTSMQKIINDNRGVNYHVENLDASSIAYETNDSYLSGNYTDEYLSLLKENAELKKKVSTELAIPLAYLTDEKMNRPLSKEQQKTTTELFLSASRFAPGKEEVKTFAAETVKETKLDQAFYSTKMWAASNEFMPGEKWDSSEESFEPMNAKSADKNGDGIIDEAAKMLGHLLTPAADGVLAVEGL